MRVSDKDRERLEAIAGQIEYALETRSRLDPEAEDDAAFLRELAGRTDLPSEEGEPNGK